MLWYGGSIAEAVKVSKQRNAIFVVFVTGDNEQSAEMSATLGNEEITKRLSDEANFLAVKLASSSQDYMHFAQMYQFVPVPSVFFIGRSGVPLEVVCAGVPAAGLIERVDRILAEHKKSAPPPPQLSQPTVQLSQPTVQLSQPSTSSHEATASLIESERGASDARGKDLARGIDAVADSQAGPAAKVQKVEYDVVCEGDVCVRVPRGQGAQGGASGSKTPETKNTEEATASSIEEEHKKIERAKELIEIRRREKAEKEKELEKQKELERRATGQGVAELRRWQAEQEMKNLQEERKREKKENDIARQRILEQIAQDKAERKARAQKNSVEATREASVPAPPAATSTSARLQFKLPSGASLSAQFDVTGTLSDVRDHVAREIGQTKSSFSLWTAFPRRELTEDSQTLQELGLAPSAALLVVTRQSAVSATNAAPGALYSFLVTFFTSMILEPSYSVYNWLRARLFPNNPTTGSGAPQGRPGGVPSAGSPLGGVGGVRRRVGNVHRLTGDADDDNNTWNGNSTQQM